MDQAASLGNEEKETLSSILLSLEKIIHIITFPSNFSFSVVSEYSTYRREKKIYGRFIVFILFKITVKMYLHVPCMSPTTTPIFLLNLNIQLYSFTG